jgi:hypothetical protein
MQHDSAQLYLVAGVDPSTVARSVTEALRGLPGIGRVHLSANLPGSWGAGDYTLDLQREPGAGTDLASIAALPGIARIDHLVYQRLAGGERQPGLQNGIWRTLLLRIRPGTSPEHITALEQDLLRMPAYMSGIRNWQLGRVLSGAGWTHIWQQEFTSADALGGEYMLHPYHWGYVHRWFDLDWPECCVEALSHSFCPLSSSLLAATTPTEETL